MADSLCRSDWPADGHQTIWDIWDQVGFASKAGEPITALHRKLRVALKIDHEAHVNGDTIYLFEEMPRTDFDLFLSYLDDLGCSDLHAILREGRALAEAHSIPDSVWNDPDPLAEDMEPPEWSAADQKRLLEIGAIAVASLQNLSREAAWHVSRNPWLYAAYQNRREQDDAGKPDPASS